MQTASGQSPWFSLPPDDGTPAVRAAASSGTRDAQFVDLLNAYRGSGGIARSGEIGAAIGEHCPADIAVLARWIVRRQVVHFEWQAETWMPIFQFGGAERRPHAAVGRSIAELAGVMPPWDVAQWFARPNRTLAGRRPADALAANPDGVWQAARAQRYLSGT